MLGFRDACLKELVYPGIVAIKTVDQIRMDFTHILPIYLRKVNNMLDVDIMKPAGFAPLHPPCIILSS